MFINTTQFLSIASSQSLNNALQISRHMMNQNSKRLTTNSYVHNHTEKEVNNVLTNDISTNNVLEVREQTIIDVLAPLGLEPTKSENIDNKEKVILPDSGNNQVTINILDDLKSVLDKCKNLRESHHNTNNAVKNKI